MTLDLTPFGFTPTESLVYATLLRLGPATGYAVARNARLARANAYGALEGLVTRGAAVRAPGRPVRFRPSDPASLIAQLATQQGAALDRLSRDLRNLSRPLEPATREVAGSRAVANLIMNLVARAEERVAGLLMPDLWRPTLPAWRRAAERAQLEVQLSTGEQEVELPSDAPSWLKRARPEAPRATVLLIDDAQVVTTAGEGDRVAGLWSSHPLLLMLARRTLETLVLAIVVVLAACRAAPIPEDQRYPAGTPFHAQYRTVDGTRLRLIDSGQGTPVVFIHGIGASLYFWRKQLPVVSGAGYRVIAFDNRGFGFSEKPAHGYTTAAYTHLVLSLLDSLRITSAVLVGHSMGGAIAAEVALRHPERVRGLVLIDAAGYGVRWPGVLRIARWPFVGALATAFRGRWATGRILRSTYVDPKKVSEADVDQYYAPVPDKNYGRALRGVLREFRFDTLAGRLSGLQTPALVLWGDADRWIPLHVGTRMATELQRGALVVVPRSGHAAPEETPDEINRPLLDFLKEGLSRIPENVAWSGGT